MIRRNGVVVFRGARVTRAPSGSFSVNRRIANAAGRDRIVATARSVVGGGVCRGVVTVQERWDEPLEPTLELLVRHRERQPRPAGARGAETPPGARLFASASSRSTVTPSGSSSQA